MREVFTPSVSLYCCFIILSYQLIVTSLSICSQTTWRRLRLRSADEQTSGGRKAAGDAAQRQTRNQPEEEAAAQPQCPHTEAHLE